VPAVVAPRRSSPHRSRVPPTPWPPRCCRAAGTARAAEPAPGAADNGDLDARRAVIEQLTPLVEPCLANQPAMNRVLTGFIVNPDGSLGDVKVKARSRGRIWRAA